MYKDYIKPVLDFIVAFILLLILWPIIVITLIITYFDLGLPLGNEIPLREGKIIKILLCIKLELRKLLKNDDYIKSYSKISFYIDRLRLNELPQLINILKGEMSFVGPRPFIPGEKLPEGKISENRYKVRPGLTGLAQVNGGRGVSHKQKLEYDDIYYNTISFKTDFMIILKTIFVLLFEKVEK